MDRPSIGFIDFTENWKSEPLGGHAERTKDKNYAMAVKEIFTNSAEHGVISQSEFFNHSIAKQDKIGGYYVVRPNDFVYNPRISVTAPVGPINRNRLDHSGVMSPLYTVFSTHDILPDFLEMFFKTSHWHQYMRFNGNSGARHDRFSISNSEFFKMPIPVPDSDEQQKVATFLNNLDVYIQRTSDELDKLKKIKQASLQAMLPKESETNPHVRFKGFTADWDCDYANNIFVEISDKGHPELPVLSATQERGMVIRSDYGKTVIHDKRNEFGYKRVMPGQFVIHLRSFQGGFAHSPVEGITSPAYTIFELKDKTKHDDLFWKYIFSSKEFVNRLRIVTYGIRDGRSISYADFLTLPFLFPSKQEQSKIASYLIEIDKLITIKKDELERLRHIKTACLNGMFIIPE